MSKRKSTSTSTSRKKTKLNEPSSSNNLASWLSIPSPTVPSLIVHSSEISDRNSTFLAHAATISSAAQADVFRSHIRSLHSADEASHEMLAWRCVLLRKGTTGLSENDFEVRTGSDDDGEDKAGNTILKVLNAENALDTAVVVSRWYGGTLLGPVRFTHIENVVKDALGALKKAEELKALVEELREKDDVIAGLALKLGMSPGKKEDYEGMKDLSKAKRLVLAREKRIEVLKKMKESKEKEQQTALDEFDDDFGLPDE